MSHTNPYKYANRSNYETMQRSTYIELLIYQLGLLVSKKALKNSSEVFQNL